MNNTLIFLKDIKRKTIFQTRKEAITPIIIGGLYPKSNLTYIYDSVYEIWIQYTNVFKRYQMETIFQSWKMAITCIIIGGFYPKSNLIYILWLYTCV